MKQVQLYDTTLRDGAQREGISFTVEDKLRVASKLDELVSGPRAFNCPMHAW